MENKKKLPLPLLILIIAVAIGLVFAGIGLFKQISAKKTNQERYDAAYAESQRKVDAANKRYAEIESELATLNEQYEAKATECSEINSRAGIDSDWFTNSTRCSRESSNLKSQISKLELEQVAIKNADYTEYYNEVKPMSYIIFYIIGGSVALLGALGAFIIYLVKGKKTY